MYLKNMLKSRRRGLFSWGVHGLEMAEELPFSVTAVHKLLKTPPCKVRASREQGGMAEEVIKEDLE